LINYHFIIITYDEVLESPTSLLGEDILPDFTLNLKAIFA